ncbi:MAG TPA: formyl transferase [Sandaracinaceae bacterium LLY-WYZ-13_1]|nr:formyl transferase [Sandaracinaceae bacterium LLY-WYZ-13_1]
MSRARVVFLAGRGFSSRVVAHALAERFDLVRVFVEEPPSRWRLVRRRARKLGVGRTANMLAFQIAVVPLLNILHARRGRELRERLGLVAPVLDSEITTHVSNINAPSVCRGLTELQPDVVVINGTRIVKGAVLDSTEAPFVNMHAGITPRYRGVHGAYWALAEQHPELCGVTVHLVDRGIDTGGVLRQARVTPDVEDSFVTYPLLQLAAGLPLLLDAVEGLGAGTAQQTEPPTRESRLYFHPTLSGYLYDRWLLGVA